MLARPYRVGWRGPIAGQLLAARGGGIWLYPLLDGYAIIQ